MDQETGHATVLLAHPRCRESFEIDTKLADIIKLLWEKELDLSYWCIRCHLNCRHPACQEALHGEVLGIGDS